MELKVTKKWKFEFSIKKNFVDEVVVDVVPLEICGASSEVHICT